MFNMLLCDLRDLEGDLAAGVNSVPVLVGRAWTLRLLWLLIATGAGFALVHGGPVLAGATVAALSPLALAARRRRTEAFYEWLADGTLFLLALVELGRQLIHRLIAG